MKTFLSVVSVLAIVFGVGTYMIGRNANNYMGKVAADYYVQLQVCEEEARRFHMWRQDPEYHVFLRDQLMRVQACGRALDHMIATLEVWDASIMGKSAKYYRSVNIILGVE
jgi:hypothetical protein